MKIYDFQKISYSKFDANARTNAVKVLRYSYSSLFMSVISSLMNEPNCQPELVYKTKALPNTCKYIKANLKFAKLGQGPKYAEYVFMGFPVGVVPIDRTITKLYPVKINDSCGIRLISKY